MSATTESQGNLQHETNYRPQVNGVEDGDTASHIQYVEGDHARYMYAKYVSHFGLSDSRMLFEHTQRQYARACNRIMRQGQAQQQESEKQQLSNGV